MALLCTLQFRPNVSNKGKIFISCSDLFWQSSNRYLLLSTKHVQFQLNHCVCALFYFIIVPACFSCSTRRRRRYRELLIRETKRCRTRERDCSFRGIWTWLLLTLCLLIRVSIVRFYLLLLLLFFSACSCRFHRILRWKPLIQSQRWNSFLAFKALFPFNSKQGEHWTIIIFFYF